MASNANNPNLFGEDSDSSSDEESASAAKQTKTSTDDASPAAAAADGGDDDDEDAAKEKSNDSGEEGKEKPTPTKNSALFGDEDSDSSSEDEGEFKGDDDGIVGRQGSGKSKAPVQGRSMNEKLGLESDSDEENSSKKKEKEEAPRKYVPPRKMELLDLPGINAESNTKQDGKHKITHHITKLPNLVGIQPKPYNATTHDMEKEEEEYKGSVHNMIRWRYKTDSKGEYVRDESGNPMKESNTRLVKWSDGSYTLHVGREVLEVDNLDSSVPKDNPDERMAGFAGINGYLYASQKAKIRPPTQTEIDGPIQEGESDPEPEGSEPPKPAGTVLECIGQITSRLGLRPSSLTSDAHRNLKLAVQKRNVKRARIAEIVTEVDPEMEKQARIKGKDDLAKSNRAKSGGGRRSGGGGGYRKSGMNERYMEEEDDYNGPSLSALKRRTMRRDEYSDEDEEIIDYGESSEEEEDDWAKSKKRKRGGAAARAAKKSKDSEEEEEESDEEGEVVFGDDDDEDDDENVNLAKKRRAVGGRKKAVFGDDDDD